ncbi:Endonuclease/exonuclease/phosphatase superfamily [Sesbania bispinosa]|nr:Endonuclease/exonuclease/phosphatase superfamily [Sesbania bispinosa]
MEVEPKGCKFSWWSNPRNGHVTIEKLDKILANWAWRSLYQNAMVVALPPISSDHSPIVFWPKPKMSSGSSFKYEAFWEDHEDCEYIIKKGWQRKSGEEDDWDKFLKKSKICKRTLMRWHHRTFKRANE